MLDLLSFKLENMKHSRNLYLKENSSVIVTKLHNVFKFYRMQILFWNWTEKMNLQNKRNEL